MRVKKSHVDGMSDEALKLYMLNLSDECAQSTARVSFALGKSGPEMIDRIKALIELDNPRRISQLAIGGKEIVEEGLVGEQVGIALNALLRAAALGEVANEKEALLSYLKKSLPLK